MAMAMGSSVIIVISVFSLLLSQGIDCYCLGLGLFMTWVSFETHLCSIAVT